MVDYLDYFYARALEYFGGKIYREYGITHVFMWSLGSYDIMGANSGSNCRVDRLAKKINEHNSQARND